MLHTESHVSGKSLSMIAEQAVDETPFGSPSEPLCIVLIDLQDEVEENCLHQWHVHVLQHTIVQELSMFL